MNETRKIPTNRILSCVVRHCHRLLDACRRMLVRVAGPREPGGVAGPAFRHVFLPKAETRDSGPRIKLILFHGRSSVDEEMEDWGFEAPPITGIVDFTITYMSHFRVAFATEAECIAAHKATGWGFWCDLVLGIEFEGDLVRTIDEQGNVALYGDWVFKLDNADHD